MGKVKRIDNRMLAIWLLVLCAHIGVLFLLPIKKNVNFGIAFVASLISYLLVAGAYAVSFMHTGTLESKLLGFPIFRVSILGLIVQLIVGSLLMAVSSICPVWMTLIIEMLILVSSGICLIAAEASRGVVEETESTIEDRTRSIKRLRTQTASLYAMQEDESVKRELNRFAEELRYSDPISSAESLKMEQQLEELLHQMNEETNEVFLQKIEQARRLLIKRNVVVKQNKM